MSVVEVQVVLIETLSGRSCINIRLKVLDDLGSFSMIQKYNADTHL